MDLNVKFNVHRFKQLRQLLLRGNKITSIATFQFDAVPNLQVLDLRDNLMLMLDDVEVGAVMKSISHLANLKFLGLDGNRTGVLTSGTAHRIHVCSNVIEGYLYRLLELCRFHVGQCGMSR